MTEKQYQQQLAALSDRYLFENMTNREYVRAKIRLLKLTI